MDFKPLSLPVSSSKSQPNYLVYAYVALSTIVSVHTSSINVSHISSLPRSHPDCINLEGRRRGKRVTPAAVPPDVGGDPAR